MSIKLILFDLDGTLVDTSLDLTASLNAALSAHGLPLLNTEDTKAIVGEGMKKLITRVLEPSGRQDLYGQIYDEFLAHYTEHVADASTPYPGVVETLEGPLRDIDKAVLTNKRTHLSVSLMDALGLSEHFKIIAGPDMVPEQKPSAEGVLHLMDKLGADKSNTVLVGDSSFDILAARAAGIPSIAVTYGFRLKKTLTDADILIDDFTALPETIKGL